MLTKATYSFFLLLLSASAFAQQQDSARLQNKTQSIVQKTDSLGKQLSTDTLFVLAELPVSGTLRDNDQLGLAQEKQKS